MAVIQLDLTHNGDFDMAAEKVTVKFGVKLNVFVRKHACLNNHINRVSVLGYLLNRDIGQIDFRLQQLKTVAAVVVKNVKLNFAREKNCLDRAGPFA